MCSSSVSPGPDAAGGSAAAGGGSGPAPRASCRCSAPAPTGLDAATPHDLETNPHHSELDPYVRDRAEQADLTSAIAAGVFGDDLEERRRIIASLRDAPDRPWANRVVRMSGCCNVPHVGLTDAGAVGAVWFRCRDRLCPLCARLRSRQVAERVAAACKQADDLRFITLTMRSSDEPLRVQLDRLYDCLRRFRRTDEWKQYVVGGVACVEVTWNAKRSQWHPHLHIIADGKFWPKPSLSRAWHAITGDSFIVDIKPVRSRKEAAAYVAKYASKPPQLGSWPDDVVQDYAAAFHRRRMILTFGSMHGAKLDGDEEHERHKVRDARVPLTQVETRSRLGCRDARIVLASLARQSLAYARTIRQRSNGLLPVLADADTLANASPRDAATRLARMWDNGRWWFGTHVEEPEPPPPEHDPPGSRCSPADTPPLDARWLERDRRHV